MCSCNLNNNKEEYHTALSEFETSTPEDWRTSTRYYEEDIAPQYVSTSISPMQQNYQRAISRTRLRSTSRRPDLTTGVAIVPRRIDFDAISDAEDIDEEDMGELARETLQRLRSAAQRPTHIPESTIIPEAHRLRRTRATQYPSDYRRPYMPRMVKITPCERLRI